MHKINFIVSLLILLCIYEFFNTEAWLHIAGVFNIADIGMVILILSLIFNTITKGFDVYKNIFSILIAIFIVMVLIQIILANMNFGQSYIDGIIASRLQFTYLTYFLFAFCLKDARDIEKFLNIVSLIAIAAIFLGIVNYFFPGILSHKKLEITRYRFGVERIFIPAMPLISFAAIWEISKVATKKGKLSVAFSIILIVAHFIRMSRMRTLGTMFILLLALVKGKRILIICIFASLFVISSITIVHFLPENVFEKTFSSSYEELAESSGTWKSRMLQMKFAFSEFKKRPIFGGGVGSLRNVDLQKNQYLFALSYKADIGYLAWLKAYGILGFIWLVTLLFSIFYFIKKVGANNENKTVRTFIFNYFIFLVGTSVTLNHFMYPQGIILMCFLLGALYNLTRRKGLS